MLDKINVAGIVAAHVGTLRNYRTSKVQPSDVFAFLLAPALVSLILLIADVDIPRESIDTLITAMSVFGALLFNLLILIYDLSVRESEKPPAGTRLRTAFLKEVHANIAFAVLVSLLTIIVLVLPILSKARWLLTVTSFIASYFLIVFAITMLMVLKRVHVLLSKELG